MKKMMMIFALLVAMVSVSWGGTATASTTATTTGLIGKIRITSQGGIGEGAIMVEHKAGGTWSTISDGASTYSPVLVLIDKDNPQAQRILSGLFFAKTNGLSVSFIGEPNSTDHNTFICDYLMID